MQEYLFEGNFVGEPEGHHYHSCDPEKEDIVAGLEDLSGEELFIIVLLGIWPF
jgi:hypothetical protein